MQPGRALYRRSTFFVDVFNVILYVDLFLFHELNYRIKKDECLKYFFGKKISSLATGKSQQIDTTLIHVFAKKTHKNILEEWVDKDAFIAQNGEHQYAGYLAFLYHEFLTNPLCNEYIQLTGFGSALKLLTKDDKVNKIIFYVPFESGIIYDNLLESFNGYSSEKISVMVGSKFIGKQLELADTYVFEDVVDVDNHLRIKHGQLTEVILPAYEYNMKMDRTRDEKMVEQVTYRRLNLIENNRDYQEKYNLSINTISVPI